jgi:hypothetical protein
VHDDEDVDVERHLEVEVAVAALHHSSYHDSSPSCFGCGRYESHVDLVVVPG